jgi:hypothetical protein
MDEFQVDQIMGHRKELSQGSKREQTWFKVRWKGHGSDADSWFGSAATPP